MKRKRHKGELTFHQKQKRKFNIQLLYEIMSWIFILFAAVFLACVGVWFFFIKTTMVGSSMEPVLCNGQDVLINRVAYNLSSPERFDVIVFKPNGNKNSHFYIKRVIGLPGETIQVKSGKVYINGSLLINDVSDDTKDAGLIEQEMVLENDEYFVMGDNRSNSEDSRSANIGNVKMGMVEGKAWFRLKSGNYDKQRIK